MTFSPGTRLGPYEIAASIGAGGMGEVYRGRDASLNRDVAIKVLPAAFAGDPERLARFRREAQVLASLNHPNIAHVYGFEGAPLSDGSTAHFLAMELVLGEDLAERLKRGAIPVDEAISIAKQIAEGLEGAHERGIIHRDLKPANIKVTPDGTVKVLDFGLAKAMASETTPASGAERVAELVEASPTMSRHMTEAGMILGTAAYMSPEQARGKNVDKRSDIWSFGVVFYEILTGRRLFSGETVSDVLAAVLTREVNWKALPGSVPASVARLLMRCLERDPKKRLRDIGEAALLLADLGPDNGGSEPATGAGRTRERIAWAIAAIALIAALFMATPAWRGGSAGSTEPLHFALNIEPSESVESVTLSPDGFRVAFVGTQPGAANPMIFVRSLRETVTKALVDTDGASQTAFSPDGRWIAFFAHYRRLRKVPAEGGPVVDLAKGNFRTSSIAWAENGKLILTGLDSDQPGALHEIDGNGGQPTKLPGRPENAGETARWPRVSPGGEAVLIQTGEAVRDLALQSLATGERRILARNAGFGRFIGRNIVWLSAGKLLTASFDATRLALSSEPAPMAMAGLDGENPPDEIDISTTGSLIFLRGAISGKSEDSMARRLVWIDRSGKREAGPSSETITPFDPRLAPDGARAVVHGSVGDEENDLWVLDLRRGALSRISLTEGEDETGVWSPDGASVAWASSRPGGGRALYRRASDGSGKEERLWDSGGHHFHAESWTADGQSVLVTQDSPKTGWDVLLVPLSPKGAARPLLAETFNETGARLSPDGRWIAYSSDESGRNEIYARAFPDLSRKVQISVAGGQEPVWNPNGDEIVYRSSTTRDFMSVAVQVKGALLVSPPRVLASDAGIDRGSMDHTRYAVGRDGRILALQAPAQGRHGELGYVLGWAKAAGLLK